MDDIGLAEVSSIRKLRELLRSQDRETVMQGVELAKSLGDDVVSQLLARTKVVSRPMHELFPESRASMRVHWYPAELPVVVPGTGLRGRPHALRVGAALELAASSECRTARALRKTTELALSGWSEVDTIFPIDLRVLRGYELRSLFLLEATALEGVEALQDLPLETLRISAVDAYDLSSLSLPTLQHLTLEAFETRPRSGTRFAPTQMAALRTLVLHSNPFMVDLERFAALPHLSELIARTASGVHDVSPLRDLPLRRLELSYSQVTDVSALPDSLEDLSLSAAKGLIDIAPLTRLQKLRRLDLSYTGIRDHRPLLELPALEQLRVRQTKLATTLPPVLRVKADAWSESDRT